MTGTQIGSDAEKEQHGDKPGLFKIPFNATLDWRMVAAALVAVCATVLFCDAALDELKAIRAENQATNVQLAQTNVRLGGVENALTQLRDENVSKDLFDGWLVRCDDAVRVYNIELRHAIENNLPLPAFNFPDLIPKRH